uniref:HAUS augmin-like complex subunit 6 N-terminal domain-containing protein n=1 Tax=Anopheles epiroticus TaxID=199890 RepID=A0A182P7D3_9DIPT
MSKKPTVVKRTISQLSVGTNVSVGSGSSGTPVSRCEEQLDAAIYRCLHALTTRYQPTDEFRAQFCRGAFLKPNTKAFIHVMHFLFNVYDAREFRKRFYWPIYDKGAENAFRTSTVEYVNSLVERGKLAGMEKIKAHVVVLPGGVKFMKFLLVLIRFVMQEELRMAKPIGSGNCNGKSTTSATSSDSEPITKTRIAQTIASHKRWVEVSERISGIIREDTVVMAERTRKMEELIETALERCELAKQISYDKLMQLWAVILNTHCKEQQKIRQRMQTIAEEYDRIISKTESKLKENELVLPFSKDQLKDCLAKYACQPGMELVHQQTLDVFDSCDKLNPFKLLQLFEQHALPNVEQFFAGFCVKNPDLIKYEYKELTKVAVKCDEIRQQIDMLQRCLPGLEDCLLRDRHQDAGESPDRLEKDNFAIKNKLFFTPPIVMDFDKQADELQTVAGANGRSCQRLALMNREDVHAMNARMKLLSASSYYPRSPKLPQKHLKSSSEQSNVQPRSNQNLTEFAVPRATRKEKLNPLTMLNRIKAQSQKQNGLSGRMNGGGAVPPVNSTMNISTLSDMTLRPEFSSTLLGTPEKGGTGPVGHRAPNGGEDVERKPKYGQTLQVPQPHHHQPQVKRMISSPNVHSSPRLMAIYAESNTPKPNISPKSLLQGQTNSQKPSRRSSLIENEATVHTSPSGRLESLVRQDELPQRCHQLPLILEPVLQEATNLPDTVDTSDEKTLGAEDGGQTEDLSRTILAISAGGIQADQTETVSSIPVVSRAENDLDCHTSEPEEDNLFNVSDGIVTDFE